MVAMSGNGGYIGNGGAGGNDGANRLMSAYQLIRIYVQFSLWFRFWGVIWETDVGCSFWYHLATLHMKLWFIGTHILSYTSDSLMSFWRHGITGIGLFSNSLCVKVLEIQSIDIELGCILNTKRNTYRMWMNRAKTDTDNTKHFQIHQPLSTISWNFEANDGTA